MNTELFQQVQLKNKLMKKTITVILLNYKMMMQNQLNFLKLERVKRLIFFNICSKLLVMLGLKMAQREKDTTISHSLNLSLSHKNKKKKNQKKSKRRMSLRKLKSSQQLKRLKLLLQKRMKHRIQLLKLNHSIKKLLPNLAKLLNQKN